ncbi:MAG: cob(I)yrinic acid a,c-diamide adenosyltransferase [Candidatus Omnitrophota bacterium]
MIQVYTGNGKGKTTAALGLALRAAGAGMKVYICQFAKGRHYSELNSLRKIRKIKLEQFGGTYFIRKKPATKDIKSARKGLKKATNAICAGAYEVVILDEINIALNLKLLKTEDITGLIKNTPRKTELILTGRYAPREILEIADLVSDIKEVKHYYKKGVKARKGIEF